MEDLYSSRGDRYSNSKSKTPSDFYPNKRNLDLLGAQDEGL